MVPESLGESPFNYLTLPLDRADFIEFSRRESFKLYIYIYIYIYIYTYIHTYIHTYTHTQFLFRAGTLTIPPEDLFFLRPSAKAQNCYLN